MILYLLGAGLTLVLIVLLLSRLFNGYRRNDQEPELRRNGYMNRLQRKLLRSSIYMRPEEFIALCLTLAITVFLVTLLLDINLLIALLLGLIVFFIPGNILETKRKKNLRKLERQLLPALAIIANGLRAGYSFVQALEVVCQDTLPPLSVEFGRVLRDNRLGRPIGEALKRMADRVGSDDLNMVVNATEIQRQMGGNMATLIGKIEQTLRDRADLEEEIKSLTAQQRFSAGLIFMLPFVLAAFLMIANPDYLLPLVKEELGQYLLAAAVIAQILGLIVMKRFMKTNY